MRDACWVSWTGRDNKGEGCGSNFDTVESWCASGTRVSLPFFCATLLCE